MVVKEKYFNGILQIVHLLILMTLEVRKISCLKIELIIQTYADINIHPKFAIVKWDWPYMIIQICYWILLFKEFDCPFKVRTVIPMTIYKLNSFFIWHEGWLWRKKRSENSMMEHSNSSPARPPQRMQPHHLQKVNYV